MQSVRAGGVAEYQNDRGWTILKKVEEIARELNSSPSAISLAWLRAHGSLPIASARTIEQVNELVEIVELSPKQIKDLDLVSQ